MSKWLLDSLADCNLELELNLFDMKPLKVFLGDLAHVTVGLATDGFPLNIGYVGAYSKYLFEERIELQLFKSILDLEEALKKSPPDVLGLSNYPWCHNANREIFEILSELKPQAIRVMGGPNFPHPEKEQEQFLIDRPWVDSYVYLDGEIGFANILAKVLEHGGCEQFRQTHKDLPIDGCISLSKANRRIAGSNLSRPIKLDAFPSPYLTGLMDPFFDSPFTPMISTNRGCPFTCTFCHDGNEALNKVTRFSMTRVKEEIDYIANHVSKSMHGLIVADLNFGMYKRDIEVCKALSDVRKRSGYPQNIKTTTGKNSKERVIDTIEILNNSISLSMSVQSLDQQVLANIKRSNIRVDGITGLQSAIRKSGLTEVSEIILGLPGETLESHKKTISQLLDAGIDQVIPYTLMLVEGSEMNSVEQRQKWGFQTKYRIIPLDFTQLYSGRKILELEEVVVETNTLSFDGYMEARQLALIVKLFKLEGFRPVFKYLNENKIGLSEILDSLVSSLQGTDRNQAEGLSDELLKVFENFRQDTMDELWDSEDELIEWYQNSSNFQRLLDGKDGKNLLQYYYAFSVSNYTSSIADWIFHHVRKIISDLYSASRILNLLDEIEMVCRGMAYNLLGSDRRNTVPKCKVTYDYKGWLSDTRDLPLAFYHCDEPKEFQFVITADQYKVVEDTLDNSGRTPAGVARAFVRVSNKDLWRNMELTESN